MTADYGTEELVREFLCEAEDHFRSLDEHLLSLERAMDAGETIDPERVEAMFRATHTLKGLAAMFEFEDVKVLAHRMEGVFDRLRKRSIELERAGLDLLFDATRVLERVTFGVGEANPDDAAAARDAVDAIDAYLAGGLDASVQRSDDDELSEYAVERLSEGVAAGLRPVALDLRWGIELRFGSLRRRDVIAALGNGGEVVDVRVRESQAALEEIDPELSDVDVEVLALTARTDEEISDSLGLSVARIRTLDIEPPRADGAAVDGAPADDADGPSSDHVEPQRARVVQPRRVSSTAGILRVDVERVDELMDLAGELVTARTRLADLSSKVRGDHPKDETVHALSSSVKEVSALVGALQEQVMRLRMVPVAQLFAKGPRVVRDLAHVLGKQADVVMEGEDTELDKRLIEQLEDPLLHLLRNAVDHGIETVEDRLAAGKPATGTVTLSARQEGGHVIIEIADDGAGLDIERIERTAAACGLEVRADDPARLAEAIMSPGFTTAERVTDVSGRGVGLDVVRRRVLDLGGSVEVESERGRGATFRLSVPLTLAIMPALLVRVGDEPFALPLSAVREVLRVRERELASVAGRRVLDLRGETLPVVALAEALALGGRIPDRGFVVDVSSGGQRLGLMVDRLLGRQEIVVKGLDEVVGRTPGVSGATILGDGNVVPIIDTDGLIAREAASRASRADGREECA